MPGKRSIFKMCLAALCVCGTLFGAAATVPQDNAAQNAKRPGIDGNLLLTVGMSMIIDSPTAVIKLSIANGDLAEAVAVTPKEILINGKAPGQTSLIVWQQGGTRLVYDLTVRIASQRLDAVREQIARDFPNEDISITFDNDTAFVRGTIKDSFEAARILAMVSTLGKAVNLLRVNIPAEEPQILLRVKFADVDRSASTDLGVNLSTSAFNQATGISTGQFGGPGIDSTGAFSLADALNVLLFRKDINLGVTIKALQAKNLLQMLSEPNVLTTNGVEASFISGGEVPIPVVQSAQSPGALTIQYRPYGIQLTFLPTITPRGSIRLSVTPEVSAIDFANAVSVSGTTVPAFTTRRIHTEVELEPGQSFVIAGLLDNRTTETLSKIPGLANIPLLGKLFQSRSASKNNSELLVIVTPEIVRPVPSSQKPPELTFKTPFMEPNTDLPMRQPGIDKTGPVPMHPPSSTMPLEELILLQQKQQTNGIPAPAPNQPPAAQPPPAAAPVSPVTPTASPAGVAK